MGQHLPQDKPQFLQKALDLGRQRLIAMHDQLDKLSIPPLLQVQDAQGPPPDGVLHCVQGQNGQKGCLPLHQAAGGVRALQPQNGSQSKCHCPRNCWNRRL